MEKKNSGIVEKILRESYLTAITIMIAIVIIIVFTRTSDKRLTEKKTYNSIDTQWTLTPGGDDYVDIHDLGQYFKEGEDTISIYWKIPKIDYDETLIFRSKDVLCKAYIDNRIIFSPSYYKSYLYTASPGNNWNFVTVPSASSEEIIELKIKYIYDTGAVSVDHFVWGNKSDWILDFLISKSLAIILSIIIILLGILIMAMNRSTFEKSGKHSLLYLGIFATLIGIWSLLETNVVQIMFDDGRLIQLLDNFMMITDSLPLFFYLDAEFDILKNKWLRLFAAVDIVYIMVCFIGQLTGLTDIHNLLGGSWIATVVSFVILIVMLAKQVIAKLRGADIKKSVIIQIVGFVAVSVLSVLTLPVYIASDGMDRAQGIRFGILVMIIMFAIAGQIQTYELIMQGTRYDIVKDLAYKDALTGLNNRTSYLEMIESYRVNPPENLGMIFFDVNNLKHANDKYGHEVGDQLICEAANVIKAGFGDYGEAYRTGGDEFIVFLDRKNPKLDYRNGLINFEKKLAEINKLKKFPFKVAIAHGFALREGKNEMYLQGMIEMADMKMYENKQKLKEQI